jgi:hypothetical protein
MKKNLMRIASSCAAFAASLILHSCVSAPGLERLTSDDCIVLIPTVINNPDKVGVSRSFYISFSDDRRALETKKADEDYIAVFTREAGLRLTGVNSQVTGDRAFGDSSNDDVERTLPYEPGSVIVADFTFFVSISKKGPSETLSSWSIVETKPEIKERCLKKFKKTKGSTSWYD